jgi:hypothetical protein
VDKSVWETPKLTIHGTVEQITEQGGQPNSDVPHGPTGTAYSPH